jgi:hypothetical protein
MLNRCATNCATRPYSMSRPCSEAIETTDRQIPQQTRPKSVSCLFVSSICRREHRPNDGTLKIRLAIHRHGMHSQHHNLNRPLEHLVTRPSLVTPPSLTAPYSFLSNLALFLNALFLISLCIESTTHIPIFSVKYPPIPTA